VSISWKNLQFSLRPFTLSDNRHDSCPHLARSLLERFVCRALLVVEVVIAAVLEDRLRHDGVALTERRGSVQDFASSVRYDVRLSVLCVSMRLVSQCHERCDCRVTGRANAYPLCIFLQNFVSLQHLMYQSAPTVVANCHRDQLA